jgi:hypothetical protein
MRRMLLTATATAASALALGAPGVASAHHHKRHHKRHATAHVLVFKAAAAPNTAPASSTSTPPAQSAGTVTGFKEGVLTITLTDGTVINGKVTELTRLECRSATDEAGERDDQAGGDDRGRGDDQSGRDSDEHGGPATSARVGDVQGSDDQGDDDQSQARDDDDAQQGCTTAALQPGATVREAELIVGGGGAVWKKVELLS